MVDWVYATDIYHLPPSTNKINKIMMMVDVIVFQMEVALMGQVGMVDDGRL